MKNCKCEMDLFDLVMNELSSTVMPRDKKFQQMITRKGEVRYKDNKLGVDVEDNAITVFSEKKERLKFAERVSEHYGCDFKIFSHNNAPVGGQYECRIYI